MPIKPKKNTIHDLLILFSRENKYILYFINFKHDKKLINVIINTFIVTKKFDCMLLIQLGSNLTSLLLTTGIVQLLLMSRTMFANIIAQNEI